MRLIKVLPYRWIWSQNTQRSECLTIPRVSMHDTNLTTSSPQFTTDFMTERKHAHDEMLECTNTNEQLAE